MRSGNISALVERAQFTLIHEERRRRRRSENEEKFTSQLVNGKCITWTCANNEWAKFSAYFKRAKTQEVKFDSSQALIIEMERERMR